MRKIGTRPKCLLWALLFARFKCGCTKVFSSVYADTFYPSGDTQQSELAYLFGFVVEQLPTDEVTYEKPQLKAILPQEAATLTYAKLSANSDLRILAIEESSVPAGAKMQLVLYPHNATGHTVYIHNVWLFSDYADRMGGSLVNRSLLYYTNNSAFNRVGKSLQFGSIGNVVSNQESAGKILASFLITQPIAIENVTVNRVIKDLDWFYEYNIEVRNTSLEPESIFLGSEIYVVSPNSLFSIRGKLLRLVDLPQHLWLKGRLLFCLSPNNEGNLLAISRNDSTGNWFWGGVQFEDRGILYVGKYCINRINTAILVKWRSIVDYSETLRLHQIENFTIKPPSKSYILITLDRVGGQVKREVNVAIHIPSEVYKYFRTVGYYDTVNETLTMQCEIEPDSTCTLPLNFEFPDQLPTSIFQTYQLAVSIEDIPQGTLLLTLDESRIFTTEISQSPLWCTDRKYTIVMINHGNVILTENEVLFDAAFATRITVWQKTGELYRTYQIVKGKQRIILPLESTILVNDYQQLGNKISINGHYLPIRECPNLINKQSSKPQSKKTSIAVSSPQHERQPSVTPKPTAANMILGEATNSISVPTEEKVIESALLGSYLFIALLLIIAGIISFQLWRKVRPKKR